MKSVAIICVMKHGGDFSYQDVFKLKTMLEQNITLPYTFYCLTDLWEESKFKTIKLKRNYHGWWSKIELFRPNLVKEQRIVYFDLDTVILSNIDDMLLQESSFIGLSPFNPRRRIIDGYIASGIMGWENSGLYHYIYDDFAYTNNTRFSGDQDYISYALQTREIIPMRWQDLVHGIYSYKRHVRKSTERLNPRIVCFHGRPRPKDVTVNWEEV